MNIKRVKWLTLEQAAQAMRVSGSTIRRRINKGEIESKIESGRRLVLVRESQDGTQPAQGDSQESGDILEHLHEENEDLRRRLSEVETGRERLETEFSSSRERSDTIIMQLTRQLDQSQRLLEHHQAPWWRRWFGKEKES